MRVLPVAASVAALALALALALLASPLARGGGDAAPSAPAGTASPAEGDALVVHEWGTFTCLQGADGVGLEGLSHEEEALPGFVYSRAKVRDCPLRAVGWKGLEVPAEHVTQKMETPVLYFHGKAARRARVRVDFVGGLITQWYPVSNLLGPPEGARDAGPLDVSKVGRSFLEWDVDLLPASETPSGVPTAGKGDPWNLARAVDAMWVQTAPRQGPERAGPVESERFLFYRGLGAFTLPVVARVAEDGRVSVANGLKDPIAHLVTLEVIKHGRYARWAVVSALAPGAEAADVLKGRHPEESYLPGLQADVAKILDGAGMNADEAAAMVATWSRSWFTSDGVRVLWLVPRPTVDALLPLTIEPTPAKVERALLGRIECVTPQAEREVEAAIVKAAGDDPAAAAAGKDRLASLGRFLEAHLRRAIARTTDPAVKKAAEGPLPSAR